jgi:FAD/FMN-containing dehydrogenase
MCMTEAVLDATAIPELLRPGDDGYDEARTIFNGMIDRRPAAIARCAGVADVIEALALARESGLEVAVRGGGHSVAGHAIIDDGLVIDLSPMRGTRVDPESRTAWCQGGLTWGELDRETQAFGLAVTGGRVPDTGVGGLTLGGGSGWIERKYGLTVDSMLSAEVVTADGRLVVASRERNADLFWALRGGGGNFGVVTGFEFRLHEVGPIVFGGMMFFPAARAVELLHAYRDFMYEAPDEVCCASAILCAPPEEFIPEEVRGQPVFAVIGCYVGPVDAGEAAYAPLKQLGPAVDGFSPIPYTIVQQLIAPGNPPGRRQYWKAGFLPELPDDAIETFVSHALDVASPFTANIMLPMGGAMARVDEDETPLTYRDARWNYHLLSQWEDPAEDERNIEWTRHFDQAMAPYAYDGVYVNFVAEPPDNVIEASFGHDKYTRLRAIKAEYDPENIFRSNTNIPPG